MMKNMIIAAVATLVCLLIFGLTVHFGCTFLGRQSPFAPADVEQGVDQAGSGGESNPAGPLTVGGPVDPLEQKRLETREALVAKLNELMQEPGEEQEVDSDLRQTLQRVHRGREVYRFLRNQRRQKREQKELAHQSKELKRLMLELKEKKLNLDAKYRTVSAGFAANKQTLAELQAAQKRREEIVTSTGYRRLLDDIKAMDGKESAKLLEKWIFGSERTPQDEDRGYQILVDMERSQRIKILESFEPKHREQAMLAMRDREKSSP